MNPMTLPLDGEYGPISASSLEALVFEHFDRAYMVFNVFEDDPRKCLALTEGLFRSVADAGRMTSEAVYADLVKRVRGMTRSRGTLDGMVPEGVLCWLLKEITPLGYAEIATVVGLEYEHVKESVANARFALVDRI